MSGTDNILFDWRSLTSDRASILEAYFALFRERVPATIGSGHCPAVPCPGRNAPSESLIRTVLAAVGVPRRGEVRPSNESRVAASDSPPLPAVRPQPPRGRKSPRR